jgi:hypothetical protein
VRPVDPARRRRPVIVEVEQQFQTIPAEVLLAVTGALLLAYGWTAFSRPRRGVLALIVLLPLVKTAASGGFVARFAPVDLFALLAALGTAVAAVRRRLPDWSSLRLPTQVLAGLGLFFALALASFLQAEEVVRSFVEFAAYGVNLVLLILVVVHIRTREQLIRCFRAWEAAVVIENA